MKIMEYTENILVGRRKDNESIDKPLKYKILGITYIPYIERGRLLWLKKQRISGRYKK